MLHYYLSKILLPKIGMGYAKLIQKKEEREKKEKIYMRKKMDTKVSEIFKTMGTQMPAWKKEREMNKIAPVL